MGRRCISWGNIVEGCTRPLAPIVPHGPIWVWISLHGLLILPWDVSIIPHRHICSKVCLHRVFIVLFSLFHLDTIQIQPRFCGRSSLTILPPRFLIHWEWFPTTKIGQHKNSPTTTFFFFLQWNETKEKMTVKYKRNSPVLVMRITSVP